MLDQVPHEKIENGRESYAGQSTAPHGMLYQAVHLLFPWGNARNGRPPAKSKAIEALFAGRAPPGMIHHWRYRGNPPDWARLLVAETLERRAAAFLAEANRLRSL